jgi:hypothetical protein
MLMTDDDNRGTRRARLQLFHAVDKMRPVIGQVENYYTEGFFLQALNSLRDIGCCTDGVIGHQGVSQISGFIFMLTDNQEPGDFINFDF